MFKKSAKKALSLLLSLSLLAPLSGCDEEKPATKPQEVESIVADETTSHTPEEQIKLLDDLGGKYKGKTYTIVTTSMSLFKSDSSDPLGKAVSSRRSLLENSFDIEIKIVEKKEDAIKKEIRAAKEAGKFYANAICAPADVLAGLAQDGLLESIASLPYVNLEADYISQADVEEQMTAGKLFLLASDATLAMNSSTVLFYNTKALKSVGLDPVKLVKDGSFTWAAFEDMVKRVNGTDGVKGVDSALTEEELMCSIYTSMGGSFIRGTDTSVEPMYNINLAAKAKDVNTSIFKNYTLAHDRSSSLSPDEDALTDFKNGKTAFMVARLDSVAAICEGEIPAEWGILPMPKADMAQSNYSCVVNSIANCLAVPVNCDDSGFSGFVLNAFLAASEGGLDEGLNSTYINYYFWDNDSALMLKLIEESLTYDPGILYSSLPFVADMTTSLLASENNQTVDPEKEELFMSDFSAMLFG